MGLIHLVCCTPDFLPIWPKTGDIEIIQSSIFNHSREILIDTKELDESGLMKGALVIESWINELKYEDEKCKLSKRQLNI